MEPFIGFTYVNPDKNVQPDENVQPEDEVLSKKPRENVKQKSSLPPPPPPRPSPFISPSVKIAVDENPDWKLVWEEEAKTFYFYNRSNSVKQQIVPQTFFPRYPSKQAQGDSSGSEVPSQIQKEDALEGILKTGYFHLIPQLLHEYGGMDLNVQLLSFQGLPTPLEFAVEQENTKLLEMLIDEEMVATLTKVVDRANLTRALGRAVDRQDMAIVNVLLANGATCEFEDSDRPPPPTECYFPEVYPEDDYMPPLVRAVKLGSMELVRLLLAQGADVNVGYHDLTGDLGFSPTSQIIDVRCGRVIQVAKELGRQDMVELFLEMGADIHLPQPTWQFHDCPMIPRAVYFRVTAGLRELEVAREATRDSDEWVLV
ncbi:uncharacterized protein TRIVIDRAFT_34258 [Trichoderma virens Gv29-8]|uniref:Uncharacterized protein n=1 Tax=Hypocrea virens (strain Gv29-8 / FGSC 10586) TaxID=413071 RepID=G9MDM2_HYPVG|nr:uncharacterized protein TRIVIDRAFT_34258 [Trichoderma virens Gv29-8]EHK27181.1 hypothetical protein TRIVIDRAFT_34258 [Trichoderma virens Gv29-8]